jgi:hypothetical protein
MRKEMSWGKMKLAAVLIMIPLGLALAVSTYSELLLH